MVYQALKHYFLPGVAGHKRLYLGLTPRIRKVLNSTDVTLDEVKQEILQELAEKATESDPTYGELCGPNHIPYYEDGPVVHTEHVLNTEFERKRTPWGTFALVPKEIDLVRDDGVELLGKALIYFLKYVCKLPLGDVQMFMGAKAVKLRDMVHTSFLQ